MTTSSSFRPTADHDVFSPKLKTAATIDHHVFPSFSSTSFFYFNFRLSTFTLQPPWTRSSLLLLFLVLSSQQLSVSIVVSPAAIKQSHHEIIFIYNLLFFRKSPCRRRHLVLPTDSVCLCAAITVTASYVWD